MDKELRINLKTDADLKGIESVKRAFSDLEKNSIRFSSSQKTFSDQVDNTSKSVEMLTDRIGFMGHAYVGFQTIMGGASFFKGMAEDAIHQADTWNLLDGRLKLVTHSKQQLAQVEADLFDIAQNSRTGYAQDADLYSRIARSTEQLGKSQSDTLSVTEAISKSLVISGASAESAEAALVQLGQGFASGVLRGEELNSVMEQSPRLAQAIANGMGVTIGQLRQMGADGKLTADAVFNAILKQKNAIEKEFGEMPITVGQSVTTLKNQIGLTIHEFDQMHGVTKSISDDIIGLTQIISTHSGDIDNYVGYIEKAVGAILIWKTGTIALNVVQKLNAEYVAASTVATTSYSIATNTTTTSIARLTAAQLALNTAMKANPWLIAGTAAVGLGIVLSNEMDKFNTASKNALSGIGDLQTTQAVQKEIDNTVNLLKTSREKIAQWGVSDSIFGNKAIEEKNAARLENRLKFLGSKLSDLGNIADQTTPKVSKVYIPTQKEIDASKKAAEDIAKARLDAMRDNAEHEANAALDIYNSRELAIQQNYDNETQWAIERYNDELDLIERNANALASSYDRAYELITPEIDKLNQSMMEDWQRLYEAGLMEGEFADKFYAAWQKKSEDTINKTKDDTIKLNTVFEDAFKSMEDSMVKMFMTGKFSAQDFFNTVIEGIIRMQIRNSITEPLTQAIGGINFGSMFSGMFSGSGQVDASSVGSTMDWGSLSMAWNGGLIPQYAAGGYTGDGGKYEPKGVVHGGEYVIPKWMVQKSPALIGSLESARKRGYADGGLVESALPGTAAPSMPVTINIENKSGTPISAENVGMNFDIRGMTVNIVVDAINRNVGGLRDSVRAVR